VCTVVCRWAAQDAFPVQMLALRDELVSRAFDLPGAWWPDQQDVIGGRDRLAGGSWCVSDVVTGVTGVVLNRPDRPAAAAGAPSRGVLPLRSVQHGERWPDFLDVTGMASFNLVLATPLSLRWWSFDGEHLQESVLPGGTYMFTPGGILRSGVDERLADGHAGFTGDLAATSEQAWAGWLGVVNDSVAMTDPSALLVRKPVGDDSFETVFGQFIAARPGTLRLDYLVHPESKRRWTTRLWAPTPPVLLRS
jgi:uncharacterized protein with NRDE domain